MASIAVLLLLWAAEIANYVADASLVLARLLDVATLPVLLVVAILGAVTLWHVYQTAGTAFGVPWGLAYVALAVLLLFLPGVFVVAHLVRLDVKRRLGIEVDEGQQDSAVPGTSSDP